ncbi:MAG: translesion error-prone DNA polymerase V subunit UmuC [Pseudomonadota bacterium]
MSSEKKFALVDCNNFYASCEKLFRPDLKHQPVVVLSNNDGCVIARSREAKALGIPMGAPYFKIRECIEKHRINVFSSNFAFYADMSARVMQTLEELAPRVEVYSIDEAFLDISGILNPTDIGKNIKSKIQEWIGLPVCIGIGPTKTLAKLANHAAKKQITSAGVLDLSDPIERLTILRTTPVAQVWGIGRRLSKRMQALSIHTALDLAQSHPPTIRKQFSVVIERTLRELNGEVCFALEEHPTTKKQILCSRSFGERITELTDLSEAISEYASYAMKKLRSEKQFTKSITVFLRTSYFSEKNSYYGQSATAELDLPTQDTRIILQTARKLLESLWRDGYRYAKAGIMLNDFYPHAICQYDLFPVNPLPTQAEQQRSTLLMQTIDAINKKGKAQLRFASQGFKQDWKMKRKHLSPRYTTHWKDIPIVR